MSENKSYLVCKDYSVSQKEFELKYNSEYEMLETFLQPKESDLHLYYEDENYISHTDSQKSLTDKIYQFVKRIALKNKLKLINSFDVDKKLILDIGCGTGDFLQTCNNNYWNVFGIEPNIKAKEIAIKKIDNSQIFSDIDELDKKKFDIITLWHVLEHIPNLNNYISKLKSLLKKDGTLIIAVPNFNSYDAIYYKNFWAGFDVPRHLWHFSKKSISKLFEKQKMKVQKIIPMKFDSFYVSLLSEKHKTGKNNFLKAFLIGLKSNLKAKKSKEYSSLIYVIKNQ